MVSEPEHSCCSMYFKAKFWKVVCWDGNSFVRFCLFIPSFSSSLLASFIKFRVAGGRPLPLQLLLFAGACLWLMWQGYVKPCRAMQAELGLCEGAAMLSSGASHALLDGGRAAPSGQVLMGFLLICGLSTFSHLQISISWIMFSRDVRWDL